jgi:hypothetical protein
MPLISACPKCQKPVCIPARVGSDALVRCPLCEAEYPLSEALPPELIPVTTAVAATAPTAAPSESSWAADIVVDSRAADVPTSIEKTAKLIEEQNEAAMVAGRVLTAGYARRRPPKSALKTFIEVVTGGLAGCLVAYYGLAFWLGPQFNSLGFPNLPLAGWVTTLRGVEDTASETPAVEKPAPAKAASK